LVNKIEKLEEINRKYVNEKEFTFMQLKFMEEAISEKEKTIQDLLEVGG